MRRKNILKKYQNKKKTKKEEVNVDNNEESVYEKIILQNAEHNDNIDLDGVDQPRW